MTGVKKRVDQSGSAGARAAAARRGFTIVEIIVVIVIIGILATLIAPRLLSRVGAAKTSVAKGNASSLASAMQTLAADAGGLRSGWTIRALWERPSEVDEASYKGPYVNNEDSLKDPWGREFILLIPGKKNVDFDIVSYGADGEAGGEGDNTDVTAP